jgi:hypothetical protein
MAVQTKRDRAAVTAGRTFDPAVIRSMSLAFRSVCNALDLKPVDHAVTRLLAEEIIELVESEINTIGPQTQQPSGAPVLASCLKYTPSAWVDPM